MCLCMYNTAQLIANRYPTYEHLGWCRTQACKSMQQWQCWERAALLCRMVGQPLALAKALGECSKIIRANPPKEKPGGCPPSLSRITGAC
jgi:hypothetical protein